MYTILYIVLHMYKLCSVNSLKNSGENPLPVKMLSKILTVLNTENNNKCLFSTKSGYCDLNKYIKYMKLL